MRRIVLISLGALALLAGVLALLNSGKDTKRGEVSSRQGSHEVGRVRDPASDALATRLVPGVVIDRVGVPIGSATVRCLSLPNEDALVDAEGAFTLSIPERGELRIEASAPGYVDERMTLDAEVTRFVRIVLARGSSAVFEVRGMNGSPVEGARVRLKAVSMHSFDASRNPLGDEESVITDSAGEARIGPVQPGPYSLQVDASGFALHREEWECVPGPEVRHVVVLVPGASVAGKVWGPDGEPVGEALVEPFGMSERACRTDSTGAFLIRDLPAGTALLYAKSELHGETYYGEDAGWREPVGVHVEPDRPVSGIAIRFGAAARVVGRVVDDLGEPVNSAEVTVHVLGCKGKSPSTASTDPAGRFSVAPIGLTRTRSIQVWIRSRSHAPRTLEPRPLEPGQSEDLGSIALARLGSISGRLVSPDGSPDRSGWVRCGNRAASVAEDGSFSCVGVVPGTVRLLAGSGSGEEQLAAVPRSLELAPGEHVDGLEISLGPTLAVEGRVVWEAGEPCGGVRVGVVPRQANNEAIPQFERRDSISGPEGWFVVPGLVPGEYRIGLIVMDAEGFRLAKQPVPLDVRAGAAQVDLVLAGTGSRVFGEVVAGAEDLPVAGFSVRFIPSPPDAPLAPISRWIESSNGRLEQFLASEFSWTVEIQAPGHPLVRVGPFSPDAATPTDLGRIRVDATAVLNGRLTDSKGSTVAGARVDVIDRVGQRVFSELRSDGGGRFSAPPLSPGRYALIAYSPGHALAVAPEIQLRAEGGSDVDLKFPKPAELVVRIRDQHDRPVTGARLRMAQSGLHWLSPRLARRVRSAGPEDSVSDAQGVIRQSLIRPGKCVLTVSAPGYVDHSARIDLVEGETKEVTVSLISNDE